jgi:hypothetical protein
VVAGGPVGGGSTKIFPSYIPPPLSSFFSPFSILPYIPFTLSFSKKKYKKETKKKGKRSRR